MDGESYIAGSWSVSEKSSAPIPEPNAALLFAVGFALVSRRNRVSATG